VSTVVYSHRKRLAGTLPLTRRSSGMSAMAGESSGEVADPHVGEAGGCTTSRCVNASTGCALKMWLHNLCEGALDMMPYAMEGARSGVFVGHASAW
jgi:hypothetical protein